MSVFVKIGGLVDPASVELVPEGGAAGFHVGVPSSPRNLDLAHASRLAGHVRSGAEIWVVTKDPDAADVRRLFDDLGADRILVYGSVPADLTFLETHHLVPSLPIAGPDQSGAVPKVPPPEVHPILQLDSSADALQSGSAATVDWSVAHTLVEAHPGRKIVLAGGLDPGNVGSAVTQVAPWGVDVTQGVERRPGEVDPERLAAFLAALGSGTAP